MSLVGTRPPTVDEWEKYELHHRREDLHEFCCLINDNHSVLNALH